MDASHNKLAADKHGFSDHQEILRLQLTVSLLLTALKRLIPTNICLSNPNLPDSTVLPCDVTLGELRAASAAIATAEGGR